LYGVISQEASFVLYPIFIQLLSPIGITRSLVSFKTLFDLTHEKVKGDKIIVPACGLLSVSKGMNGWQGARVKGKTLLAGGFAFCRQYFSESRDELDRFKM
jgi:hypothetical protein